MPSYTATTQLLSRLHHSNSNLSFNDPSKTAANQCPAQPLQKSTMAEGQNWEATANQWQPTTQALIKSRRCLDDMKQPVPSMQPATQVLVVSRTKAD
jgi:hypothetical protein